MVDINGLYLGKAYSFKDFNCWHYVSKVRKDNGINTKQFYVSNMASAYDKITNEMRRVDHGLVKVESPQNLDIIIVHKTHNGKTVYHCGLLHNGNVAHCSREARQVRYQSYKDFIKGYEGAVIWR